MEELKEQEVIKKPLRGAMNYLKEIKYGGSICYTDEYFGRHINFFAILDLKFDSQPRIPKYSESYFDEKIQKEISDREEEKKNVPIFFSNITKESKELNISSVDYTAQIEKLEKERNVPLTNFSNTFEEGIDGGEYLYTFTHLDFHSIKMPRDDGRILHY